MEPAVKLLTVIEVAANKGRGLSLDDPIRRVFYYYDAYTEELLAWYDPWEEENARQEPEA